MTLKKPELPGFPQKASVTENFLIETHGATVLTPVLSTNFIKHLYPMPLIAISVVLSV